MAMRECTEQQRPGDRQVFGLAAAHLEGLALLGAVQGLVVNNTEFLAEWNLPHVRQGWTIVGGKGKEVTK
jgi:hypothetical protein